MNKEETYLPQGTILKNRYEVISVIGTGGFGITYRAVDQLLDCYVAIKEFFPKKWASRENGKSRRVAFYQDDKSKKIVDECLYNFRHEAKIM